MKVITLQIFILILLSGVNTTVRAQIDDNRFSISPGETRDIKLIEPRCLVLTGDYQTSLSIMGRTFPWTLPKGTKYVVEAGTFQVANHGSGILEFDLLPETMCSSD